MTEGRVWTKTNLTQNKVEEIHAVDFENYKEEIRLVKKAFHVPKNARIYSYDSEGEIVESICFELENEDRIRIAEANQDEELLLSLSRDKKYSNLFKSKRTRAIERNFPEDKICSVCGYELAEGMKYCPYCGQAYKEVA